MPNLEDKRDQRHLEFKLFVSWSFKSGSDEFVLIPLSVSVDALVCRYIRETG
jgi:hypothetical protein